MLQNINCIDKITQQKINVKHFINVLSINSLKY
nr:MAG TPA: hypothetical protein [Caudoviricetes sp.]